jgi:hypothetical protein
LGIPNGSDIGARARNSRCMFQFHHILPKSLVDHPVIGILVGRFNHDAITNLMALPSERNLATELGSSPHTGGHLGTYYEGFEGFLEGVKASPKFNADRAGDPMVLDEMAADVNRFLAAAKYALANGHLLTNTPTGMTPEDANEKNKEWFANWESQRRRGPGRDRVYAPETIAFFAAICRAISWRSLKVER